jgi:hypothetical protein
MLLQDSGVSALEMVVSPDFVNPAWSRLVFVEMTIFQAFAYRLSAQLRTRRLSSWAVSDSDRDG